MQDGRSAQADEEHHLGNDRDSATPLGFGGVGLGNKQQRLYQRGFVALEPEGCTFGAFICFPLSLRMCSETD
jgi:hypothetical protein